MKIISTRCYPETVVEAELGLLIVGTFGPETRLHKATEQFVNSLHQQAEAQKVSVIFFATKKCKE
ncbi:MAG: hypothetical protein C4308_11935 [Chitinophagaceae bacterium]